VQPCVQRWYVRPMKGGMANVTGAARQRIKRRPAVRRAEVAGTARWYGMSMKAVKGAGRRGVAAEGEGGSGMRGVRQAEQRTANAAGERRPPAVVRHVHAAATLSAMAYTQVGKETARGCVAVPHQPRRSPYVLYNDVRVYRSVTGQNGIAASGRRRTDRERR